MSNLKIILVILSILFFHSNLKGEEIKGSKHSVGLGFLIDYEYSEPYLMHLRSGQGATQDEYANIGYHRWNQVDITTYSGSTSTYEYKGNDIYYGFGIGYSNKGFAAEIEYLEHDMYYDAKSYVGTLKYNF